MHPIIRGPSKWQKIFLHPKNEELMPPSDDRHTTARTLLQQQSFNHKLACGDSAQIGTENITPAKPPLFYISKISDRKIDHLDLWNYEKFRPDYDSQEQYELYLALSGFVDIYRDIFKTFRPYRQRKEFFNDLLQPLRGVGNVLSAIILFVAVIPYLVLVITGLDLIWRLIKLWRGGYKNSEAMWSAARSHILINVIAPLLDIVATGLRGVSQIVFTPAIYVFRMPLRGLLYFLNRAKIKNAKMEGKGSYRDLIALGEKLIIELTEKNPKDKSRAAIQLLWVCYRLRVKYFKSREQGFSSDMPEENQHQLKQLWDHADLIRDRAWIDGSSNGEIGTTKGMAELVAMANLDAGQKATFDPLRAPHLCALASQDDAVILHNTELLQSYFSLFKFPAKHAVQTPDRDPPTDQYYVFVGNESKSKRPRTTEVLVPAPVADQLVIHPPI